MYTHCTPPLKPLLYLFRIKLGEFKNKFLDCRILYIAGWSGISTGKKDTIWFQIHKCLGFISGGHVCLWCRFKICESFKYNVWYINFMCPPLFENTNSSFQNTNSSFQNTNSSFQNNTNCDIWYHYFYRSPPPPLVPHLVSATGLYNHCHISFLRLGVIL